MIYLNKFIMGKNRPYINGIIIVYASDNYTDRGNLTTSAIIWYNLVHCFTAVQNKIVNTPFKD